MNQLLILNRIGEEKTLEVEAQDYSKIMMLNKSSDEPVSMNNNINIQIPPDVINSTNYQHLTSRI